MSMMRCTDCDAVVDTDDGTGLFDPRPGKTGFWCESCVEAAIDEPVTFKEAILALKAEDRATYNEAMADWYDEQEEEILAETQTEVQH